MCKNRTGSERERNNYGARGNAAIGEAGEVGEEAAERMSERGDTAYSPRFREEEHSATTDELAQPRVRVSLV